MTMMMVDLYVYLLADKQMYIYKCISILLSHLIPALPVLRYPWLVDCGTELPDWHALASLNGWSPLLMQAITQTMVFIDEVVHR